LSFKFFEPEGSSSGRQLRMQLYYGTFYLHQYKQSSRYESLCCRRHKN